MFKGLISNLTGGKSMTQGTTISPILASVIDQPDHQSTNSRSLESMTNEGAVQTSRAESPMQAVQQLGKEQSVQGNGRPERLTRHAKRDREEEGNCSVPGQSLSDRRINETELISNGNIVKTKVRILESTHYEQMVKELQQERDLLFRKLEIATHTVGTDSYARELMNMEEKILDLQKLNSELCQANDALRHIIMERQDQGTTQDIGIQSPKMSHHRVEMIPTEKDMEADDVINDLRESRMKLESVISKNREELAEAKRSANLPGNDNIVALTHGPHETEWNTKLGNADGSNSPYMVSEPNDAAYDFRKILAEETEKRQYLENKLRDMETQALEATEELRKTKLELDNMLSKDSEGVTETWKSTDEDIQRLRKEYEDEILRKDDELQQVKQLVKDLGTSQRVPHGEIFTKMNKGDSNELDRIKSDMYGLQVQLLAVQEKHAVDQEELKKARSDVEASKISLAQKELELSEVLRKAAEQQKLYNQKPDDGTTRLQDKLSILHKQHEETLVKLKNSHSIELDRVTAEIQDLRTKLLAAQEKHAVDQQELEKAKTDAESSKVALTQIKHELTEVGMRAAEDKRSCTEDRLKQEGESSRLLKELSALKKQHEEIVVQLKDSHNIELDRVTAEVQDLRTKLLTVQGRHAADQEFREFYEEGNQKPDGGSTGLVDELSALRKQHEENLEKLKVDHSTGLNSLTAEMQELRLELLDVQGKYMSEQEKLQKARIDIEEYKLALSQKEREITEVTRNADEDKRYHLQDRQKLEDESARILREMSALQEQYEQTLTRQSECLAKEAARANNFEEINQILRSQLSNEEQVDPKGSKPDEDVYEQLKNTHRIELDRIKAEHNHRMQDLCLKLSAMELKHASYQEELKKMKADAEESKIALSTNHHIELDRIKAEHDHRTQDLCLKLSAMELKHASDQEELKKVKADAEESKIALSTKEHDISEVLRKADEEKRYHFEDRQKLENESVRILEEMSSLQEQYEQKLAHQLGLLEKEHSRAASLEAANEVLRSKIEGCENNVTAVRKLENEIRDIKRSHEEQRIKLVAAQSSKRVEMAEENHSKIAELRKDQERLTAKLAVLQKTVELREATIKTLQSIIADRDHVIAEQGDKEDLRAIIQARNVTITSLESTNAELKTAIAEQERILKAEIANVRGECEALLKTIAEKNEYIIAREESMAFEEQSNEPATERTNSNNSMSASEMRNIRTLDKGKYRELPREITNTAVTERTSVLNNGQQKETRSSLHDAFPITVQKRESHRAMLSGRRLAVPGEGQIVPPAVVTEVQGTSRSVRFEPAPFFLGSNPHPSPSPLTGRSTQTYNAGRSTQTYNAGRSTQTYNAEWINHNHGTTSAVPQPTHRDYSLTPDDQSSHREITQGIRAMTSQLSHLRQDIRDAVLDRGSKPPKSRYARSPFKAASPSPRPRSASRNELMKDFRTVQRKQLSITKDSDIVEAVTQRGRFVTKDESEAFVCGEKDVTEISLNPLKPYWEDLSCEYNHLLAGAFADNFLNEYPMYTDSREDVITHFHQRLTTLRAILVRSLPKSNETEDERAQRVQERSISDHRLSRRNGRRSRGFDRRLHDTEQRAEVDEDYALIHSTVDCLGPSGYSSDETDPRSKPGEKRYIVKNLRWRNKKLRRCMDLADACHPRVNVSGNNLPGGTPGERVYLPDAPDSTTPAPEGKPINYYEPSWYIELPPTTRTLLRAGSPRPFYGEDDMSD